ncbi:FG-GAP-like repeat-containing protein [Nioella sp.]|uniref:FG-GAP-like repeat-containing protein n=1 Tax=Nioella sp. TaxID=1912091 RepID=UPI003A8C49D4
MPVLSYVALLERDVDTYLTGITDLDVRIAESGEQVLYATSRSGAAISAFTVTGPDGATLTDHQTLSTDTDRIDFLSLGGESYVVTLAPQEDSTRLYTLDSEGRMTGTALTLSGETAALHSLVQMQIGQESYLYCTDADSGALDAFRVGPDGSLAVVETSASPANVAGLARADIGASQFLVMADADGQNVRSYRVDSNGALTEGGVCGVDQGLGVAGISTMEHISLADGHYVIVAARDSSSISVLRMDPDGTLSPVDHIIDDLNTRFQHVTSLETVMLDDRAFVIAGGADDGVSFFELLPGGRLLLHDTIADRFTTTLENVSAIGAAAVDNRLQVFVGSGTETGITQFTVDPGPTGTTRIGGSGSNTLTGTDAGEVLAGRAGDDMIEAGGGDDVLMDGSGRDTLTGGAGRDVFVMEADGTHDEIRDFNPSQDRIDLTAWPMLRNLGQIEFTATSDGAVLRFGTEELRIHSHDGLPLAPHQVLTQGLIALTRVPAAHPEPETDPESDLTGDGTSDILWRNGTTGSVGMFDMAGGTPSWQGLGGASTAWQVAGLGDVDGDGTDDILWRNETTGGTGMFAMGSGIPVWNGLGTAGAEWQIMGVGDFNGDGTDDILWQNSSNGGVGMFAMSDGSSSWQGIGGSSAPWEIVATGDITGDGIDDIIWRNATTGQVGQFEMSSSGTPTWSAVANASTDWRLVGTGDFDGDGTDDLLWRHEASGAVGMYAMGSGSPVWLGLGQASFDWDIVGTGDYNGDGTDDILWRNVNTGSVGMYDMASGTPNWQSIGQAGLAWDVEGQFVDEFVF